MRIIRWASIVLALFFPTERVHRRCRRAIYWKRDTRKETHADNQVLNNQSILPARAALWFNGWLFTRSVKASVCTGLCNYVHATIDETSCASCPFADGCPNLCNGNGQCTMGQQSWHCECQTGWRGAGCSVAMETSCADNKDNEGGELGRVEQWSSEGGIESRLALLSFVLLREMRKESQFGLCQRIEDYGESEVSGFKTRKKKKKPIGPFFICRAVLYVARLMAKKENIQRTNGRIKFLYKKRSVMIMKSSGHLNVGKCIWIWRSATSKMFIPLSDGLTDCMDPDCCIQSPCQNSPLCRGSRDPLLIIQQNPSSQSRVPSFYERVRMLVGRDSTHTLPGENPFNSRYVKNMQKEKLV